MMVNPTDGPSQVPFCGVIRMVAISWFVTLAAVNMMFPVPEIPRPMAGLSFVQLKVVLFAGLPESVMLMGVPLQTSTSSGTFATGVGFTVMLNVIDEPVQGPLVGITVIVAFWVAVTAALVKLMSPVPEAPSPMEGLLFVQMKS